MTDTQEEFPDFDEVDSTTVELDDDSFSEAAATDEEIGDE